MPHTRRFGGVSVIKVVNLFFCSQFAACTEAIATEPDILYGHKDLPVLYHVLITHFPT